MKRIIKKGGYTLAELIVSLAIVAIFMLSLTMVLSVGSKLYLTQTAKGNTQVAIETLSDDMKGYIMYGKDIKVIYVTSGNEAAGTMVAGEDVSSMLVGTEIYLDKIEDETITKVYAVFKNPDNTERRELLTDNTIWEEFVGNGIDLGYKKLYLTQNNDGTAYIKGLSYDISYYRGLNLNLQVRDIGFNDADNQGVYVIDLSGEASTGYLKVKTQVAVTGLNEK